MLEMLQSVDPPVFYAVVGVIVLAIASLVGLVLFASKEETFEDVVAKQRKAQEALLNSLQGASGKSGKNNRKWNKLKNKKASKAKEQEEEPESVELDSGVDDDEPTPESVTVATPPPIIPAEEPAPAPPVSSKKKKKGKKNKQPAIVEDVPVPAATVTATVTATVEEVPIVEDDVEVVESEPQVVEEVCVASTEDVVESEPTLEVEEIAAEELEEAPADDAVEVEQLVKSEPEIIEEPAPADPIPEPVVESTSKSRKKKSNKSDKSKNVITNTVDKLASELENSHLSGEEVQQIMDVLVKKQSELEQWQKPNQKSDPMEILKKRIAEAEMQFAEERQSSQSIALKNKELRLELQQERNARQSIQNEASNRLSQQAKEGDTMRKRMEEKHLSEMHSAQSQIARVKEENGMLTNASMMAQQLAEDKQSLVSELNNFQQQNKQLRQELDNVLLHNQSELNNLHKAKVDSENALTQRLHEMSDQLMKAEAQNRNIQQVAEQQQIEFESQQQVAEQQKMEFESQQQAAAVPSDELNELNAQLLQAETRFNESESIMKVLHEQLEVKSQELEETRSLLQETQAKLSELESTLAAIPEPEKVVEAEVAAQVEAVTEAVAESVDVAEDVVEDVEPVNDEVAKLVATVEEKNQLILVLEQKVAALESHSNQSSGQHSPDMVVVTSSDLLGSEPILTSESFEEVSADKDCDSTQEIAVEVAASDAVESTSEESLLVEAPVPAKSIEALEKEIEDLKEVEKSLRETIAQMETDQSKAEESLLEAEHQLAESNATIVAKDDIIAERDSTLKEKEGVIADNMVNILDLTSNLEISKNERDSDVSDSSSLTEKLKQVEEELTAKTVTAEQLTVKNNELREKNWRIGDALGQAEKSAADKIKSIEISICKGLKNLFPEVSIPKYGDDFDKLFKEFGDHVTANNAEKPSDEEAAKIKEINEKLMEEIKELQKTNELMQASQDEIEKSQEENIHLKNVLSETESMLSRLQTGVDAEVQKWQKKVSEKDAELEENNKSHEELKQILSKHGYEHENIVTLEANLSSGQKQLMAEKEENSKIKKELEELEKNLAEAREQMTKQTEAPKANDTELTELNTKLKKTISERDLLIREYKSIKDSSTKMEAELKETKESLATHMQTSDEFRKEIEQLKGCSGSNDTEQQIKDKDAEIATLTTQVNDLKEELREERDCVIVDIDPDNAENLHKQVENLSTELESEKQCKANLASKLHDIEKSYQEECSDSDKILDLESKLKSAEQQIKQLEEEKSQLSTKTRQEAGDLSVGTSV